MKKKKNVNTNSFLSFHSESNKNLFFFFFSSALWSLRETLGRHRFTPIPNNFTTTCTPNRRFHGAAPLGVFPHSICFISSQSPHPHSIVHATGLRVRRVIYRISAFVPPRRRHPPSSTSCCCADRSLSPSANIADSRGHGGETFHRNK